MNRFHVVIALDITAPDLQTARDEARVAASSAGASIKYGRVVLPAGKSVHYTVTDCGAEPASDPALSGDQSLAVSAGAKDNGQHH